MYIYIYIYLYTFFIYLYIYLFIYLYIDYSLSPRLIQILTIMGAVKRSKHEATMEPKWRPKRSWRLLGPPLEPRAVKERPRAAQERPTKGPRRVQDRPRSSQEGSERAQVRHFGPHWVLEGTLKSLLLAPNQHKMLKRVIWEGVQKRLDK